MRAWPVFLALLLVLAGGWWALHGGDPEPVRRPTDEDDGTAGPARLAPGARTEPDGAPGVTLAGRVVDVEGRPVPGALLSWVIDREEVAAGRTDGSGRYLLHGPEPRGELRVSGGTLDRAVVRLHDEDASDVRVRLRSGGALEGRVLSPDLEPVPNARVRSSVPEFVEGEVKTDAAGRFRLAPVPADGDFTVFVEAGSHGRTHVEHVLCTPGAALEVVLPPVFSVRGRVVRADTGHEGEGVAGLEVGNQIGEVTDGPWVKTDAEGRFVLEGLTSEGSACVGGEDWWLLVGGRTAPGAPDLVLEVVPRSDPATIRGRAVDEAGHALAGAEVRCRGARTTISDGDGRFILEGAKPYGDVYDLHGDQGDRLGRAEVPIDDVLRGEEAILCLELRPAVCGRVVNEEGRPLEGAKVTVFWRIEPSPWDGGWTRTVASGEDGAFLGNALDAVPSTVTVRAHRHLTWQRKDVRPRVGRLDLGTIVLRRLLPRPARVVDEAGAPVPSASYLFAGMIGNRRMPVEPDGTFEVLVAPDGALAWLSVSAPGYLEWSLQPKGPPYPERFDVTLRRAAVLAGRVVDLEGAPVRGVRVCAWGGGGTMTRGDGTWTDLAGRFRLEVTGPGTYEVFVSDTDLLFPPANEMVAREDGTPPDEEPVIRAVPPRRIAGTVVDTHGRRLAGVQVRARFEHTEGETWVTTDGDGRFSFERRVASAERIWIEHPPSGHAFRPLEHVALGSEDVWIQAEPAFTITGDVVWEDGRPAVKVYVNAYPEGHLALGSSEEPDEHGRFRLEGLLEGTYRVESCTWKEDHVGAVPGVAAGAEGVHVVLHPAPGEDGER